jgi:hypothetical protein
MFNIHVRYRRQACLPLSSSHITSFGGDVPLDHLTMRKRGYLLLFDGNVCTAYPRGRLGERGGGSIRLNPY